ncbi:hypothetical protein PR048_019851 [Dryococelus australis]|uniref:Uncharacterized protein n=1 Tax=Dryococelus australis TaxID=614101 RepID=A0ABQ9H4M1_9NEOP|nr:hypothetical protein PR048_019851 [Dryococelus australis]
MDGPQTKYEVKDVHNKVSTFETNLGKKSLLQPAYSLTGALEDMRSRLATPGSSSVISLVAAWGIITCCQPPLVVPGKWFVKLAAAARGQETNYQHAVRLTVPTVAASAQALAIPALKEMFSMLSISTNRCIDPPLYGQQDALMNPWEIPDSFATHYNFGYGGRPHRPLGWHTQIPLNVPTNISLVDSNQGSSGTGMALPITPAMAFHSNMIQPADRTERRWGLLFVENLEPFDRGEIAACRANYTRTRQRHVMFANQRPVPTCLSAAQQIGKLRQHAFEAVPGEKAKGYKYSAVEACRLETKETTAEPNSVTEVTWGIINAVIFGQHLSAGEHEGARQSWSPHARRTGSEIGALLSRFHAPGKLAMPPLFELIMRTKHTSLAKHLLDHRGGPSRVGELQEDITASEDTRGTAASQRAYTYRLFTGLGRHSSDSYGMWRLKSIRVELSREERGGARQEEVCTASQPAGMTRVSARLKMVGLSQRGLTSAPARPSGRNRTEQSVVQNPSCKLTHLEHVTDDSWNTFDRSGGVPGVTELFTASLITPGELDSRASASYSTDLRANEGDRVTRPGIEPGSPWREASRLTAQQRGPNSALCYQSRRNYQHKRLTSSATTRLRQIYQLNLPPRGEKHDGGNQATARKWVRDARSAATEEGEA